MGGKWSAMHPSEVQVPEINTLLERDPYLKPYENEIRKRYFKKYININFKYVIIKYNKI